MNNKNMIIVGDKFDIFSQNEGVLTVNEVMCLLNNNLVTDPCIRFHLGQGVHESQITSLIETANENGLSYLFKFESNVKSGSSFVHKHKACNSMLGLPRKVSEGKFEIDVLIHDQCDEMGDHMTGQHIQGMVITEAARQSLMAVTEAYYLNSNDFSSAFVFNSLNTKYINFVFPVAITLEYEITKHKDKGHGSHYFETIVNIIQNDTICAEITAIFSTYNANWLENKESALAHTSIQSVLTSKGSIDVAA